MKVLAELIFMRSLANQIYQGSCMLIKVFDYSLLETHQSIARIHHRSRNRQKRRLHIGL